MAPQMQTARRVPYGLKVRSPGWLGQKLRWEWDTGDPEGGLPRTVVGRLLALFFVVCGLLTILDVIPPVPPGIDAPLTALLAVLALVCGGVLWFIPWQRWPRSASLGALVPGFTLIAAGNRVDPNPYTYSLPFVTAFFWIGITHPRGTSLRTLPLCAASYAAQLLPGYPPMTSFIGPLGWTVALCAVLGETLAWVMQALGRAQDELHRRRSEARFQALVQNTADLVTILDANGSVQYQSPSSVSLLGVAEDHFLGQPFTGLVHPDDVPRVQTMLAQAAAQPGNNVAQEFRLGNSDGFWRDVEAICRNLLDNPGVGGIVLNARDITDRRRAEAALRFQKSLLEAQGEVSPDGILAVAPDGRILSYNRRFAELWRLPEEVLARGSDEAVLSAVADQQSDPQEYLARVAALSAQPGESTHEEIALKDGRTFDRHSAPVRDAHGASYGRVWFFRDITAHKQAPDAFRHQAPHDRLTPREPRA
jgi:PAS domain S-box-containing protein